MAKKFSPVTTPGWRKLERACPISAPPSYSSCSWAFGVPFALCIRRCSMAQSYEPWPARRLRTAILYLEVWRWAMALTGWWHCSQPTGQGVRNLRDTLILAQALLGVLWRGSVTDKGQHKLLFQH